MCYLRRKYLRTDFRYNFKAVICDEAFNLVMEMWKKVSRYILNYCNFLEFFLSRG